jgi:hypothetical protein
VLAAGRLSARAGAVAALLVMAALAAPLRGVYALPKQDFTGARDFVEAAAGPRDAKVAVGAAKLALPGYYATGWRAVDDAAGLAAVRAAAPRTWVVFCLPEQLRAARPDLAEALARDFEVAKEFPGSLMGGAVTVARTR